MNNKTRFAWGAKLASPPAPHSTESHQNLINIWPGWVAPLEQIGEAVQDLQSNMWSWILLKNEKKNNSPDFFLRATEHTQKIKFGLYNHITKFW